MLESFVSDKFTYKKIPLEEQKSRGILGRLTGVIADTKNATRNGRKYSSELWKKVFENDIMKEKIANRCVFSELGHPADREEVDLDKVCACLAEQPKLGSDGKLYGVFDILDTNNGRILKTLCDYGTTVGVSSRGTGDLYTDADGNEAVDPETYNCECFDIVIVPAVREARLQYVTESLDTKKYNKTLRESLQESLDKANEDDKKIMEETLTNLGINLDESFNVIGRDFKDRVIHNYEVETREEAEKLKKELEDQSEDRNFMKHEKVEIIEEPEEVDEMRVDKLRDKQELEESTEEEKECNSEDCSDKKDKEVGDAKSDELVAEFKESLKKINELNSDNLSLQEQLSVCNAKENELKEQLAKYKQATVRLSESAKKAKNLKKENASLTEQLNEKDKAITNKENRITRLAESDKVNKENISKLTESNEELGAKVEALNNQLDNISKQLDESKELLGKYRNSYNALRENYLNAKAQVYGISLPELKQNLTESYKLKDVDSICKKLVEKKNKLSKLPFVLNEATKISVKPANEYICGSKPDINSDDSISSTLLNFINN